MGISGSAPFVIEDGDATNGISLDIWRRVAEDNVYSYELIPQPSPKAGIEAVDEGEIDVLVGPVSITSGRLAMPGVDFTQPYYLGKSGVLLPIRPPSILSRVQVFFGWAFTLFLCGATESAISTPEQLNGRRVAVVEAPVEWSWPNAVTCGSLAQPTSRAPFNCWWISRPMP